MPSETCAVRACPRASWSRGWCRAHYMRWYATGDIREDEPLKHYARGAEAQFAKYVNREGPIPTTRPELGPCWSWTGRTNKLGYAIVSTNGRMQYAHRWAYERFVGPVPEGFEPDHLCRNPGCVNYERHLEVVTHRVNTLRGESPPARFARRDACSKGHRYTPENTFIRRDNSRGCRTCDRARSRQSYLKRKARSGS
jgi:hypothetical protein